MCSFKKCPFCVLALTNDDEDEDEVMVISLQTAFWVCELLSHFAWRGKKKKKALQRWSHFRLLQSLPSFLSRGLSASFHRTMTHWFKKTKRNTIKCRAAPFRHTEKGRYYIAACAGKWFRFGTLMNTQMALTKGLIAAEEPVSDHEVCIEALELILTDMKRKKKIQQ